MFVQCCMLAQAANRFTMLSCCDSARCCSACKELERRSLAYFGIFAPFLMCFWQGNFLVVRRSRHLPTTAPYSAIESTEYVIDMHPCFVSFFYRLVGLSPDHLRVSFASGGTVVHTANITVMATEWTKHTVQVPTTISTFKVSRDLSFVTGRGLKDASGDSGQDEFAFETVFE